MLIAVGFRFLSGMFAVGGRARLLGFADDRSPTSLQSATPQNTAFASVYLGSLSRGLATGETV